MPIKLLVLLTILLSFLTELCQGQSMKVNFGLNRTNVVLNPEDIFSVEDGFKTGFFGELIYKKKISSPFYVGGGIGFIQKGYKFEIRMTDQNGEDLGISEATHAFNYFNFSIHGGLEVGKEIYFISDIAVIPSLLINSKVSSDLASFGGNTTDRIDKFDLSAQFLIGLGKRLNEKLGVELNLAYRQSLKQSEFGNIIVVGGGDNKYSHLGVILNLGVTYNL